MKSLDRREHVEELARRLHALAPDSARRWGTMTPAQMLCHVSDAFLVAFGDLPAKPLDWRARTLMKWIALYAPFPWPKGVETLPEIDQRRGRGTPPAEFAADVARVERQLREMAARPAGQWQDHPIFGAMSDRDWRRWGYLHVDHHLRQFGV